MEDTRFIFHNFIVMHPYIPHPIEDIKAAERPDRPLENLSSHSFEEEMEAIERWASGENEPDYTFSYY